MRLRVVICLLFTVALAIIPSSTYEQTSQQATSLVALNYYPKVAVGSMTTISFDVTYSTSKRVWLMTVLGCEPKKSDCSSVSIEGISSSPFPCNSTDPFGHQGPLILGTCYLTITTSGVDFFTYNLSFGKAGTYELTASSQLNYPGDLNSIPGSRSTNETMTITVTGP